jgi:hypothetical protein
MSPAFDYYSGVMLLDFQVGGRVPTIHGYPYLWKLCWEFMSIVSLLYGKLVKKRNRSYEHSFLLYGN